MDMQDNELRRLLNCALIYIYIKYKLVLSKTKREILIKVYVKDTFKTNNTFN
jgi:hypothetical protein